MTLPEPLPVTELAELLQAKLYGNTKLEITGINEIHQVEAGDLTFVDHPKYYDKSLNSAAGAVIIDKKVKAPKGKALLVHPRPFDAYNELVLRFPPFRPLQTAIHESAVIDPVIGLYEGMGLPPLASLTDEGLIQAHRELYDDHLPDDPNLARDLATEAKSLLPIEGAVKQVTKGRVNPALIAGGGTDALVVTGDANPGTPAGRETYLAGASQDAGTLVIDPNDSDGAGAPGINRDGDEVVISFSGLEPVDSDTPAAVFDVIMTGAANDSTI